MKTTILGLRGKLDLGGEMADTTAQDKLRSLIVTTLLSKAGIDMSDANGIAKSKAEDIGIRLFPMCESTVDDTEVNREFVNSAFGRLIILSLASNNPETMDKARVLSRQFTELNKQIDALALELGTTEVGSFIDHAIKAFEHIVE